MEICGGSKIKLLDGETIVVWVDGVSYSIEAKNRVLIGHGPAMKPDGVELYFGDVVTNRISPRCFLMTISANVDNQELSDSMFRDMIRSTLPGVET